MNLFTELKRRNVFRVGIAYVITAWLIAQVLELVFDSFGAPDWTMKAVLVVLAAGLPLVLIFSWIFELTPEGLKRDSELDHSDKVTAQASQKLNRTIIVVLVLALAYFVWESRFAEEMGSGTFSVETENVPDPVVQEAATTGNSVAVLPFMNMSSDPEQEYFSDGITEEIINALVKVPGLAIPARTSVFAYKGRLQDVREIGRELNVAHVLEGSIRSQGKQVRITAQLINVDTGYHLWSETFDRQLENIFAVQEEIAGSIAEVLVGELGVETGPSLDQTRNMAAYDLYLQGRAALRNRDDRAIELFEAVTQQDPDFVPGWAAKAMAHNSVNNDDESALQAAEKALSMDPNNVDALNAKAAALRGLRRWNESEAYFEQALAIDPSSAELLEDYAEFLNYVGRANEALEVTQRAVAMEPGLLPLQQEYVIALLTAGRVDEARDQGLRFMQTLGIIGWMRMLAPWLTQSDSDEPVQIPDRPELPVDDDREPVFVEYLDLMQPDLLAAPSEDWGRRMRQLLERDFDSEDQILRGWSAYIPLIQAGQVDFVAELQFSEAQRFASSAMEWIWTPPMAPLRQHPRFAEYLSQVGLVDYWDSTSWPKWCQRNEDGMISCQ